MMIDDVWSFNGVQENFSLQWFTKSLLDIIKRARLSIGSGSVIVSLSTRFFVGLLKDRLSKRNILRWKHVNLESYNYELCSLEVEESAEHLFLHCPFTQQCWGMLNLTTSLDNGILENFSAF